MSREALTTHIFVTNIVCVSVDHPEHLEAYHRTAVTLILLHGSSRFFRINWSSLQQSCCGCISRRGHHYNPPRPCPNCERQLLLLLQTLHSNSSPLSRVQPAGSLNFRVSRASHFRQPWGPPKVKWECVCGFERNFSSICDGLNEANVFFWCGIERVKKAVFKQLYTAKAD